MASKGKMAIRDPIGDVDAPAGSASASASSPDRRQGTRAQAPDGPPAYSDAPAAARPPPPPTTVFPGYGSIDFAKYDVPESTLSADGSTTTTTLPLLSSDAAALEAFLREQAALPPKSFIRVVGEMGVVDFDIKLNMMASFVSEDPARLNYVKVVADGEPAYRGGTSLATKPMAKGGLREWTQRFCADSVRLKTFTLERVLVNWNTEYLEGQIRSLVAATKYRGHVTVTFNVTRSKVVVNSSSKFFGVLSLVLETKRYEVVKAIWPYSTSAPSGESTMPRQFAVQSEELWWNDWKPAIRYAILSKRRGWVTVEDRIDAAMGPRMSDF